MPAIARWLRRICKRAVDQGASAVEYGMMVAAIAAVIVGVVFGLGGLVREAFSRTCSAIAAGPSSVGDASSCGGASSDSGNTAPAPTS